MNTRTQLTLFAPAPHRASLETLRRELDPVQAGLIAAHVTLCREDEIDGLSPNEIELRVRSWPQSALQLTFGPPVRFDGHGVLLPCLHGTDQFQNLRRWVLQNEAARSHQAHLTLAHPRNPRAPGNTDDALLAAPLSLTLEFTKVACIEQSTGQPWQIRSEFPLSLAAHRTN
ncbi:MAG: hypothetical protein JSS02_23070 [Planctomycetes bacterium]|nr:hypothetical protein [Planctomycetota bacterium]